MSRFVPPARWRKLAKNVWKTDLGRDLPEVVVLRMSDEEFKEFHSSVRVAKNFLDKRKYLKRKLIKLVFTSVKRNTKCGEWTLIVVHTLQSTGFVTAWQD
ncbi:MAG TPA: hypothetical protein VGR36_01390 [Candidatus Acidoferrales bacterium]|nr:hypothetical protein [Candidatus Acidoferrales bacterium]